MKELFSDENQVVTIVIIGVLLLLLMAIALLIFFFFSRKKIVEKELRNKNQELEHQKEMIHASIQTQEIERKRIAQDLHDEISSKLNVILLNSNLMMDGSLSPKEYTTINNSVLDVTKRTLESARKLAHDLLPPILEEFGLTSAIEELVDDFNISKKVSINCQLDYHKDYLEVTKELHLFRIIQELINNSIRHGKAKEICLGITKEGSELAINYSDNGIGFDSKDSKNSKGLGTKNIESRVEILDGLLTINSEINKGIQVSIII
jgi:two-component system NarL family sensor kinase